jgi:small subunit ribosomal protein S16
MLKIKLARFGKKHQPHYRIVVNEARDKRDGKYVASVGHYAPTQVPKILELDLEAYNMWVTKGAQPTETVAALAARVKEGKPFEAKTKLSKKAKAKLAKPAEEVAEAPEAATAKPAAEAAPAEPVAETVAPEAPATEEKAAEAFSEAPVTK